MKRKKRDTRKKKNTTLLTIAIIIAIRICSGVLGYCIYNVVIVKNDMDAVIAMQEDTKMKDDSSNDDIWGYMNEFNLMKGRNDDFMGWIRFDSNLINLPFMYSGDDLYLRSNFEKQYSSSGTVYMDGDQSLDNKNITLYGHYVYANEHAMFTPLDKLRYEENYEENKIFRLYLENEIRTYAVAAVVEYNTKDKWNFDAGSYSKKSVDDFLQYGNTHRLYPTSEIMDAASNYVTLQTCIRGTDTRRTIVIGKEKERNVRDTKR